MKPKLFRIIVQVDSIQRAADFYQQVLGVAGQRVSPGRHYFDCDGTILACLDPKADGDDFDARPNVDYVYLAVRDVEATFTAVQAAGGTLPEGDIHGSPGGRVAVRPWGEKSFYALDPFGNQLCFVERATMFTG